jgi:copper(I)-binding protein
MRKSFVTVILAALSVAPAFAAAPGASPAAQSEDVTARDAWARASAGKQANGAAYLTLTGGAETDALVAVSTPVAATAELHESSTEGGVMRMRAVPSLRIPAGQTVSLAPGGYHIMLFDLKQPLKAGDTFPVTLTFERAAPVTLNVQVRGLGASAAMGGMGAHDHMQMK